MRTEELERWLCGPLAPEASLDDLASAFGLAFETPAGSRADTLPRWVRFALAVLRDAFPTDGAVRRWLRAPLAELGGQRPLDVLLGGQVERFEEVAVREWARRAAADRPAADA